MHGSISGRNAISSPKLHVVDGDGGIGVNKSAVRSTIGGRNGVQAAGCTVSVAVRRWPGPCSVWKVQTAGCIVSVAAAKK